MIRITQALAGASALAIAALAAGPASAQRIDNIVSFGDSYADTGNAVALILGNPAVPQPVKDQVQILYGSGRFSGLTNYIDTLSELTGATVENYAVGGALTGTGNVNAGLPGFTQQVQIFLSGTTPPGTPFPDGDGGFEPGDLLAVSVGANDARAYQQAGGDLLGAPTAATAAAATASANLDLLVGAGAETISFLAGNTAILPEVAVQPDPAQAAAVRNAYSTTFNTAIQQTLAGYAADGVMVHYLDLTLVAEQVMADPAAFGLTGFTCPAGTTCILNRSAPYLVYVDGLHLTAAGFAIVGRYVAAQLTAPLTLGAPSELGLDNARQFGRVLSGRMDFGAPRDGGLADGLKLFVAGDSFQRDVGATMTNDEFAITSAGLTAGVQYGMGNSVVGLAARFSKPDAEFGNGAAEVETDSMEIGAFGAYAVGPVFAQAYVGYGRDEHEIRRRGVVDGMQADTDGDHWLAGAKAGYLTLLGPLRVGPVAALDYAKAEVDGYTEDGDPALELEAGSISHDSLRGSIGLEARGDFAPGGLQLRPFGALAIEKELSGGERDVRFAQTASPGIVNSFEYERASRKAYGRFTGGAMAQLSYGLTLDAGVSLTFGKEQGNETSGHLGLKLGL